MLQPWPACTFDPWKKVNHYYIGKHEVTEDQYRTAYREYGLCDWAILRIERDYYRDCLAIMMTGLDSGDEA